MTPAVPLTKAEWLRDGGGRRVWLFTVVCPFCGREHTHGGGVDERPEIARTLLGHRSAPCRLSGYVLSDPDGRIGEAAA